MFLDRPRTIYFYIIGFLIWVLVTIAFRMGDLAFLGGPDEFHTAIYIVAGIVIAALVIILSQRTQWPSYKISAGLALPGMLLDVSVIHLWPHIFPDLPARPDRFGALMLWCYAVPFIVAALIGSRKRPPI